MMNNNGTISIDEFFKKYKEYKEIEQIERVPGEYITDFDYPKNKWKIIEHKYKYTGEKKYWDICSYDILKYDEESLEFKLYMSFGRNYHSLGKDLIAYVIQNNKEFLITSSDYQYLTILNLTDKEIKSYSYGNPNIGAGFCPISIKYFQSSDNNLDNELKVYGCFLGAPYETLIIKNVDLNNLSNSYNMIFQEIDEPKEDIYNIEDILTDDELTKYESFNIDEGMIYNTIKAIKDNQYFNSSKDKKEYFNNIIIKALLYYFDNVL